MYLLKEAQVVNRGRIQTVDVLTDGLRIAKVAPTIEVDYKVVEVGCNGRYLIPGVIDDQVHFRQPGFPQKGTIGSEARAGVAGGITTFMEMPNTNPAALTRELLEDKYAIAAKDSIANYSFYLGASNTNLDEILAADYNRICGIKAFLGSSTGAMLIDDPAAVDALFKQAPALLAIHAEDEETVKRCTRAWKEVAEDDLPADVHRLVRPDAGCYKSSSFAVELAKKYGTRLHVLHITTALECALFEPGNILDGVKKQITAEVCVHHLHFSAKDYDRLGNLIKCNPAIKTEKDRLALWDALLSDRFDVIATDHAPHTLAEKQQHYWDAPSGLPLVQHSLPLMLYYVENGQLPLTKLVDKMCHAPAVCFAIEDRGYLEEGMYADIVLLGAKQKKVKREDVLYHVGWSPLEGQKVGSVDKTWVSGTLAYDGKICTEAPGMRLTFAR